MYCQDGSNLEQLIQPSGIIEMPLEDGSQQKLFIIHPQPNQVVITKLCQKQETINVYKKEQLLNILIF